MLILRHACNIVIWIACGLSYSTAGEVSFVTKEVEYRLGESVMIPLKMDKPVAERTPGFLAKKIEPTFHQSIGE